MGHRVALLIKEVLPYLEEEKTISLINAQQQLGKRLYVSTRDSLFTA